MALWQITTKSPSGNKSTYLQFSEGGLSFPKGKHKNIMASRFKYTHTHPIFPPTFLNLNGKKYLMPQWEEVHPETTLQDVEWKKPKLKPTVEEFKFTSSSSNKVYVTRKTTDSKSNIKYSCNCPGYFRSSGNCKHVKELKK